MPEHRRTSDEDQHPHAREDDRRQADALEQRVGELAVGVIGLRGALESVGAVLKHDVEGLREEIDTQRRLSKWNRRTHFMVQFWVALFALHVGSVLLYAERHWPLLADFVFWMTPGDWRVRLAGLVTQVFLLYVFWHRTQVPPDLLDRTPASGLGRTGLYRRIFGRAS